ncbi:hypothetical protein [Streptomyces sp. NRRL WC-3742]|uniref:hypothetical protein n=1 Tax=Streptomyces sp. NRRL WC-3742 TaxID=1463934 RepID=UPI0004C9E8EF|nr:hypothetical protein [Streptomyces sp. NRRL WC-3742]
MRTTNRALRQARRLVPAVALTSALLAGGAVLATPASAESGPLSLTVHAPNEIGFAGGPVEFTETVGNRWDRDLAVTLELSIDTATGTPPHALSLDYVNARGAWESVPLTVRTEADRTVSSGVTGAILVPRGGKEIRLRIGAPMGEPHNGATNGGVGPTISLRSTAKGPQDAPAETLPDTRTIVVGSISNSMVGVPVTAVAGGAPIEFEVQLTNPTPSAYTDLGNVLFADRHAKVEVRGTDGTWSVLAPVVGIPDDPAGFYVEGRDSSAAPGSYGVKRVRVTFPADMPLGRTSLNPCVFVNEGPDMPFRGTTMCSAGASVQVLAPSAPAPSAPTTVPDPASTPADQGAAPAPRTGGAPAPARSLTDVAPVAAAAAAPQEEKPLIAADGGVTPWSEHPAEAGGSLAATGADTGWDRPAAGIAALLLGGGAGVLALVRRRRATR